MDMLNYEVEVLIAKGQNHFLCKKRFDDCFTKELEKADYLIDEVFKSLLKQMNEQEKEAEKMVRI